MSSLTKLKVSGGMWEIVIRSNDRKSKKIVTGRWSLARDIIRTASDNGYQASLKRYFADVLVADETTGDFVVVATRIDPKQAAKLSYEYAKIDRTSGCTLWPHGVPFPPSWNVITPDEDSSESAVLTTEVSGVAS
jgi:hypothetical protein